MKVKELLRDMCLIPALCGHEQKMAAYMRQHFSALGLPVEEDVFGNCIATVEGTDDSLPKIMIFGHMDQLGFFVRYIEETGFLRLERVGGIPEKALPALNVQVQCRDGSMVNGAIGIRSHHITPPEDKYTVEKYTQLFVDIGAHSREQVIERGIAVGSPVVYQPEFRELLNDMVSGTSMDNRVATTVLLELAQKLSQDRPRNTVYLVGTVQEEFNLRGAMMAARTHPPDIAIGLDIEMETGTPDMQKVNHVRMGAGPVMCLYNFHGRGTLNGTIAHPGMVKLAERAAKFANIPLQRNAHIGGLTDLAYLQLENTGVKALDIGIPCRYTHTPTETCSISDVEMTVVLVAEMVSHINEIEIERGK